MRLALAQTIGMSICLMCGRLADELMVPGVVLKKELAFTKRKCRVLWFEFTAQAGAAIYINDLKVMCDTFARTVIATVEILVGINTAMLGGTVFYMDVS